MRNLIPLSTVYLLIYIVLEYTENVSEILTQNIEKNNLANKVLYNYYTPSRQLCS